MRDHTDLQAMNARSLAQQSAVRKATFSPDEIKTLRPFSIWEISSFMFGVPADTLRKKLADDPSLPQGHTEEDGRQRWFSLSEINELRRRVRFRGKSLQPDRPKGRAMRVAVSNFKGGVGKTVVAQHLANAAALDGYRVLVVDFDPQATLSHSMGLTDVAEDYTVWGIMARDLIRETDRMNAASSGAASGTTLPRRQIPGSIRDLGLGELRHGDFIKTTAWSTIDIIPSCANAAFVEFASAQYRHLNPEWSFFAAVSRFLDGLADDAYDLIVFDCPPAIGYQSMNAVFAADVLYIPSGPGYWEYDSTTSFIGQLSEALEDLSRFSGIVPAGTMTLPKAFCDIRFLLTRFEPANELHRAMQQAFGKVFGDRMTTHPIEMTRAVEQSGRFLSSIYEIDYRDMTRETWRRARASFDGAYGEFRDNLVAAWDQLEARA